MTMKDRFIIDNAKGRHIMIVHYSPAMDKTEQRRIYNEYFWPMPKVEGIKWIYPEVALVDLEAKAFEEVPIFVIDEVSYVQQFGRATRPNFIERLPTRSGKHHPGQPKPSHRDLYRNRKNGRR